jgi:hypothetical protein
MPFEHLVDSARKTAYVRGRGALGVEAAIELIRELAEDPGFRSDFLVLVDLREAGFAPSSEEVRRIVDELGSRSDKFRNRIAMVAAGELSFGVARMLTSFAEARGLRMAAFRDPEEAERWLGVGAGDIVRA